LSAPRAFDIVVAAVAIVVTVPLWLTAAVANALFSRGPVLYRARRVGRGGNEFTLYKFRSMRKAAAAAGPRLSPLGDQRVTRVGRALRKTKIDELPQLFNVLRGEMSIVGPRPEDPAYVVRYTSEQRRLLEVRPGITSPASVQYRNEEALLAAAGDDLEAVYERILADKLAIELTYLERRSVRTDLQVLLETLRCLVKG
jgi:lipopolysaccharide/colanic/teichoic acid biosynthesis glycosyltransferase